VCGTYKRVIPQWVRSEFSLGGPQTLLGADDPRLNARSGVARLLHPRKVDLRPLQQRLQIRN
jgi:hypothetical protein